MNGQGQTVSTQPVCDWAAASYLNKKLKCGLGTHLKDLHSVWSYASNTFCLLTMATVELMRIKKHNF